MGRDVERFRAAETALWDSVGVRPTERFVTLRSGVNVRVQELGEGPPALFIHGVTVAGSSWCRLACALPDLRCILIDRPGCGLSDPLPPGSVHDLTALLTYADDLAADVLDALDLLRAHLISTSYGGLFALRGAAKHSHRINRIVQFSWTMGAPMDKVPVSMRIAAVPGMRSLTTRIPVTRRLVKSMLSQVGLRRALDSGTFTDVELDWTVALLRHTNTLANEMRTLPDAVTPLRGMNRALLLSDDTLSRVGMPTLLLWGDEDPNGGRGVAEKFAKRLPDCRLDVIDGAGHAPWIDRLDDCVARTSEFLGG